MMFFVPKLQHWPKFRALAVLLTVIASPFCLIAQESDPKKGIAIEAFEIAIYLRDAVQARRGIRSRSFTLKRNSNAWDLRRSRR
jgi:hypothetical protein